jgi:hypothetical protein
VSTGCPYGINDFREAIKKLATFEIHAASNPINENLVAWKLSSTINGCVGVIPEEDIQWANTYIKESGCLTAKARNNGYWKTASDTSSAPEQCLGYLMNIVRNL